MQRRLTALGFDTKVNGKFNASTRAAITRWQGARGYPKTGFLNTLEHKALLTESVSAAYASSSSSDQFDDDHLAHRRGGGGAHHHRSGGVRSRWPDRRHDGRTVRTQVTRQIVRGVQLRNYSDGAGFCPLAIQSIRASSIASPTHVSTDLPVRLFWLTGLSSPFPKKYSAFPKSQITLYPTPSCSGRGALAIVTNVGTGCGGRGSVRHARDGRAGAFMHL